MVKLAVFGGGASTTAPMTYILHQNIPASFYGEIYDSLLFRGRDCQKTFRTFIEIAQKYKKFSGLLEKTTLYYRFLDKSARKNKMSIADTIDAVYHENYEPFKYVSLFHVVGTENFVPVEVRERKKERVFERDGIDFVKLAASSSVYSHNGIIYENLIQIQKELHYLPVFYPEWKPIVKLDQTAHVVNRAGFKYPGNDVGALMSGLNFDLAKLNLNFLSACSDLNELERTLQKIFSDYVSKFNRNVLDSFENAVIVGGGRAAGEIARRLTNDVDWKQTSQFYRKTFAGRIPHDLLESFISDYEKSVRHRRKNVVVVDHKELSLKDFSDQSEKLMKVASSTSYSDFFFEICKHGVCPELGSDEISYYMSLAARIKSLFPDTQAKFIERIEYLLNNERNGEPSKSYKLFLTESRDISYIERQFPNSKVFSIGGATQDVKLNSGLTDDTYHLTRIKPSHYREMNLKYVEAVGQNKIIQLGPKL